MVNQGTVKAVESRVNAEATRDMVGLWLDLIEVHIQKFTYLLMAPTCVTSYRL
jgi:hypothetical protein